MNKFTFDQHRSLHKGKRLFIRYIIYLLVFLTFLYFFRQPQSKEQGTTSPLKEIEVFIED